MTRPSFQFYPADWRNNAKLRRCSAAARGAWMDVLCILHDSDEYGVVRWSLADLARAAGVSLKLAKELAEKGVLKGGDSGAEPFVYMPTHAGRKGEPVVLVQVDGGPVWYSSRFLRDEWTRGRRGVGTRFDTENQPNRSPTGSSTRRVGELQGDGASSSSSSSSSSLSVGKSTQADSRATPVEPSTARAEPGERSGQIAKLLKANGIQHVNPTHAKILELAAASVTDAEVVEIAKEAVERGKPNLSWACSTLLGRKRDAAAAPPTPVGPRNALLGGSGAHRPYVPERRVIDRARSGAAEAQAMADIMKNLGMGQPGADEAPPAEQTSTKVDSQFDVQPSGSTAEQAEAKNRPARERQELILGAPA